MPDFYPLTCLGWERVSKPNTHFCFLLKNGKMLDNKGFEGVVTDLSKALDTINCGFWIAKLHNYGFLKESLKLIKSYLTNWWQRMLLNTGFSKWEEILLVAPQRSVLGSLLLNYYIDDLFFLVENTNLCNYVDVTKFHACDSICTI